jgi:hypothetical protein
MRQLPTKDYVLAALRIDTICAWNGGTPWPSFAALKRQRQFPLDKVPEIPGRRFDLE